MFRRLAVVFLLVSVSFAQDLASRMDQAIQPYVPKRFMGSVLVSQNDKMIFEKSYGSANLEWGIPNTATTKFRLGSLTKQFTAASILLLEERGKLKVDAPVKTYMPDAPAAWDRVTIFHLLTHTSGIPSFTGFPDYASTEAFATTPEKLVARFKDKPLEFEPGEKWNYSNSGYVLLGYLIEKISGQTYREFVQQNIFTPLGMKDSGFDSNSEIILRRASGYTPTQDGIVNAGYINMTIPFSAGSLYSTTEDLLRWEQGLFGGRLLSAASLTKMTTPYKEDYAFGVAVSSKGRKVIEHEGGIEGFNTQLSYYPDDKLVVVVLANLNGPAAGQIGKSLAKIAHGEAEQKEVTVAAKILDEYAGTYALFPSFDIVITVEGGRLMAQATNQVKLELHPISETRFFYKEVDAQVDFVREGGVVTKLILHQGGRDMPGVRR